MEAPSDLTARRRELKAKTRIVLAFFFLFLVMAAASYGAWYASGLMHRAGNVAADETQSARQAVADPAKINEALKQHPSNRMLQMIAIAAKAADDTDAAFNKLSAEIEPAGIAKANLATANRADLEALRRDLQTAATNASSAQPRYAALLKTERDAIEKQARALYLDKEVLTRLLASLDQHQAQTTAVIAKWLPARADYYRAYDGYVAVLATAFGTYKVDNGQFIFQLQGTVDRYNVAAHAMTVAAKKVADLDAERKGLGKVPAAEWERIFGGK